MRQWYCPLSLLFRYIGSSKQLAEASVAVRLLSLLLERAFVQLLETEGTDEMFRMELFPHCSDASARDWFLTAGAEGPSSGVVMDFAIRLAVVFEVAAAGEGHQTLAATEALVMPLALQSGHVVGGYGKVACFAPGKG